MAACLIVFVIAISIERSLVRGGVAGGEFQRKVVELKLSEQTLRQRLASTKSTGDRMAAERELAAVLRQEGEFGKAAEHLRKAVSLGAEIKGEENDTATLLELSQTEREAGEFTHCRTTLDRICAIDRSLHGVRSWQWARDLNNLGTLTYLLASATELGEARRMRFSEARDYFLQAARVYESCDDADRFKGEKQAALNAAKLPDD